MTDLPVRGVLVRPLLDNRFLVGVPSEGDVLRSHMRDIRALLPKK